MKSVADIDLNNRNTIPLYIVMFYLFLEFGRPQNLVPFLAKLHLPAFTIILIGLFLVLSHKITLKAKQTWFFLLILCEMIIHGPIAVNNYWAFMTFYTMCVTFIGYCGIVGFVDTFEKFEKLIKYWFVTFIFLAIIGIKNKGVGIGGFIGDENDFCMALNTILPFTMFSVFMDKSRSYKIYCILLTCLLLFVIMLTKSRGGFVGLMAVVFYSIMKSNKKFIFFTLVCFLGLFLFMVAPSHYWDEMGTIGDEATKKSEKYDVSQGTGSQRLYAWKLGWGMFKEHPILGVGQGNYPWNVVEQEEKMGVQWQERSLGGRAAHSLYFTLLPELGLVGVAMFFMIIMYIWKDLKNVRNVINKGKKTLRGDEKNIYYYTLAIEAGTIGFLFSSVFISTLYYPNFWILTGIMLSLRNIVINSQYIKNGSPAPSSGEISGRTIA